MIRPAKLAVFAVALTIPAAALAQSTGYGKQVWMHWTASDRCARAAQTAFPDFTAESNAKRDEKLKQCLAASNLPPRGSLDTLSKP